jgi:hypothetical protein
MIFDRHITKLSHLVVLCYLFTASSIYASPQFNNHVGLERVSDSLMGVTSYVNGMFAGVSLLTGLAFLIISLVDLKRHFQNPIEVTAGRVFSIFIVGVALFAIPFLPKAVDPGPIQTSTQPTLN